MAQYATYLTTSLPSDRAIVVFSIRTPNDTATVHLVGSWDNFSAPLLMGRDLKSNTGAWKVCLGSSKYGAGASIDGLKMGGRYTYYFVINGHIQMPDPTVAERVVDPRSGTICSVLNVPFQVAAGQKVIAGSPELSTAESFARELSASQKRQSQRAYPFDLNQNDGYVSVEKPTSASMRANAPQRPTVVIPNGHQKQSQTSPISAVPSLTPSSGLNSAVSPTSVGTPYSGRLNLRSKKSFGFSFSRSNSVRELGEQTYSPSESGRKRGFHLKTPSIPSISNLINSNSKARPGFPVISNPIPQDFDISYRTGGLSRSSSAASRRQAQCTGLGLGINMASRQSSRSSLIEDEEQEILEAQDQAYNAVRSRKMASSISRPLSVASTTISDSPSLTQSEFSVESSPSPVDDASSISSSPMQSFDSDIEIETDDEEENVVAAMMASKLQLNSKNAYSGLDTVRVDDLADMENWYRSAARKSRSSRNSRSTRFSDVSCATRFEESQDDLYPSQTSYVNRSWPSETGSKPRRPSPSLHVHAPMPVRPEAEAVVAIESMEAQAEARLRSFIRSSWGRFDYVEIGSESISEEYQDYLTELSYLRREVEDLRREKEYLCGHLSSTQQHIYY